MMISTRSGMYLLCLVLCSLPELFNVCFFEVKLSLFFLVKTYLVLMLVLIGQGFAYAEENVDQMDLPSHLSNSKIESDAETNNESASVFWSESSLAWMHRTRQEWSSNVVGIGRYIDNLMGTVDNVQDLNKSYLKIDFALYDSKYGKTEFDPRVRFSLDLPILEEKLRLVFETEPDQTKDIDERKLEFFPSSTQTQTIDDIYASFRYLFQSAKWTRLSWDTGVKIRVKPDLFTRGRAVRSWAMTPHLFFRYSQELFWFESLGLGAQTQFDFDRHLNKNLLFRKTIALDWGEREARFDLLNQISLFHTLNAKRAVQYALGLRSDREKYHTLVNNYFVKTVFRASLYKNWLFYQLETGLEYPREEGFRSNPFIGLKLEVLFADDAAKQLNARLD
tara:strand:+ start:5511 stop:6686 length:1176 start_codon:yes stop_codon:yes gene_type:complete